MEHFLFGMLFDDLWQIAFWGLALLILIPVAFLFFFYGSLWIQAFVSNSHVSMSSLLGMTLRQVDPRTVVAAKILGRQAGLDASSNESMTTARLEAHVLAGGNITRVVRALVESKRAGIELDFDQASAIDLAGRDVLDAVRTNVFPKVIDCPDRSEGEGKMISGIAKDGVELLVRARVTVRTNLGQLIGGATEQTIIARVGQGIVSSIGDAETYSVILESPEIIADQLLASGLESNTSFFIVSIDIADIDVGRNVGARLRSEQAAADMRTAQASAEARSANAIARRQEMKAKITFQRSQKLLAEAEIPKSIAFALLAGNFCSIPAIPIVKPTRPPVIVPAPTIL